MSLAGYVLVAFGFAAVAWATRGRGSIGSVVGVVGLLAAVVAALAIRPGDSFPVGDGELAATAYTRLFLVVGSLVGLGLAVIGLAARVQRELPTITLATLAFAALTLSLTDARAAVMAATAGGVAAALLAIAPGGDRAGASVGMRDVRAVLIAGAMALAATAWIGRDLGQLDAPPVVFGLAFLAVALAVAIRFGAIPFHLWVARLTDAVPEPGLPIVTVLAAAPLAIVGLGWTEASITPTLVDLGTERGVILAVAVASIVLAAIAALVQDDLEHVVGYSIVGDAGVALLALVALDPAVSGAARLWILALVVTRSAFAAWAAGLRLAFGTGRIIELRGWLTRSPVLAAAFALVVIASIGVPGLAVFDARSTMITAAVDDPFATLIAIGVLTPLAYYGRLLSIGLARPDGAPQPGAWRPRVTRIDVTSPRAWWQTTWDTNRGFAAALVAVALALLALGTAGGAFGDSVVAAEPAAGSVDYSSASTQRSISRS